MDYIDQTWLLHKNNTLPLPSEMPSLMSSFLHGLFLLLAGFLRWGSAAPVQTADVCPGYKASNVVRSDSSITADLVLAGSACNLHGQDLKDLRFLAEWQTGMALGLRSNTHTDLGRFSSSRDDLRPGRASVSSARLRCTTSRWIK